MRSVSNKNYYNRYLRHFPIIGLKGQKKISQSTILCIGAGGLGCSALQYLTSMGVGKIVIIDYDYIELSNLQRQIIYKEKDIGKEKAVIAAKFCSRRNSFISILSIKKKITEKNAAQLILKNYNVVIDATDNFLAKYTINKICRLRNIPLVSASIFQFSAQLSIFNYNKGPCYECLFPITSNQEETHTCNSDGVLGVVPGILGNLQAIETIKIILNKGILLSGFLLVIDFLKMNFFQYKIFKNSKCCKTHCGNNDNNIILYKNSIKNNIKIPEINVFKLSKLIGRKNIKLIDIREEYERKICKIKEDIWIPESQILKYLKNLNKKNKIIIYCRSGIRSSLVVKMILQNGLQNIFNLKGGILQWIDKIDKTLQKY